MPIFALIPSTVKSRRLASFTLIELLTVIAIIAILAAITLAAAGSVMKSAARKRAQAEIQAMSAALESYKTDNGIYPVGNTAAGTVSTLLGPPTGGYPIDPTQIPYQTASAALYQALTGQAYMTATPVAGSKSYMTFKSSQVGNPTGPLSYIQDSFGYSYGYSTGSPQSPPTANDPAPYNGAGFFDLWSTGGLIAVSASNPNPTNSWITNWQN